MRGICFSRHHTEITNLLDLEKLSTIGNEMTVLRGIKDLIKENHSKGIPSNKNVIRFCKQEYSDKPNFFRIMNKVNFEKVYLEDKYSLMSAFKRNSIGYKIIYFLLGKITILEDKVKNGKSNKVSFGLGSTHNRDE